MVLDISVLNMIGLAEVPDINPAQVAVVALPVPRQFLLWDLTYDREIETSSRTLLVKSFPLCRGSQHKQFGM